MARARRPATYRGSCVTSTTSINATARARFFICPDIAAFVHDLRDASLVMDALMMAVWPTKWDALSGFECGRAKTIGIRPRRKQSSVSGEGVGRGALEPGFTSSKTNDGYFIDLQSSFSEDSPSGPHGSSRAKGRLSPRWTRRYMHGSCRRQTTHRLQSVVAPKAASRYTIR